MKSNDVVVGLWTISDACAFLKCSRSHVYNLLKTDPKFPIPRRLGSAIRFLPNDFFKYVDDDSEGGSK